MSYGFEELRHDMAQEIAALRKAIEANTPNKTIRIKTAAEDYDLKPATIRKWVRDGLISKSDVGGIILLDRAEFEGFIRNRFSNSK